MTTITKRHKPYRTTGVAPIGRPSRLGFYLGYVGLILFCFVAIGPFIWQLSTSLKGVSESVYTFPPQFIPDEPNLDNYRAVMRTIPVISYAWHSLLVSVGTVVSNAILATFAGYAFGILKFRGKFLFLAIIMSTMILPGEVTLTSQYLTIQSLGLANSLVGVFLPSAVTAINVMLMTTACAAIPPSILEAATIDGASTLQRIRHIVWPNVRGMVSVVALMSFIQAWDDFLWPLVVLSDPELYTLTVGMQYLQSNFGSNPKIVAAGTMLALLPIIILFVVMQKQFFAGVEDGGVKG